MTPGKFRVLLPQVSSDTAQDVVGAGGGTGNEYEENRMRRGSPAPGVSKILVQLQTDGILPVTVALASKSSQTQRTGGSNNQREKGSHPERLRKKIERKGEKNKRERPSTVETWDPSHLFSSILFHEKGLLSTHR